MFLYKHLLGINLLDVQLLSYPFFIIFCNNLFSTAVMSCCLEQPGMPNSRLMQSILTPVIVTAKIALACSSQPSTLAAQCPDNVNLCLNKGWGKTVQQTFTVSSTCCSSCVPQKKRCFSITLSQWTVVQGKFLFASLKYRCLLLFFNVTDNFTLSSLPLPYVQLQFCTLLNELRKLLGKLTRYLMHIIVLEQQGNVGLLKRKNISMKFLRFSSVYFKKTYTLLCSDRLSSCYFL